MKKRAHDQYFRELFCKTFEKHRIVGVAHKKVKKKH